ncbi:MAG: Zn-ribbon domain-containing OB-fold protein [Chloroflexi bacterium]|nr:Zn-ribbon domain-containing OB-fold protein [Chloroflexota bacterium]
MTEERATDLRSWPGEMPVSHLYTLGLAGERFFRELMESGRLLATRCERCRYTYMPPRVFCERCFASLDEWVEVGPEGTLRAASAAYVRLEGERLDEPEVYGLIQMDGADGLLLHRLRGVDPQAAEGLRVKPVLRPKQERQGSILDISHFEPV